MLINRSDELRLLEELHKEKKPKLIIIYGRRRVGKTTLLLEFARKHKVLYLLGRQESSNDQLKKISSELAEHLEDQALKLNPFRSYDAFFTYLHTKEIAVIFDEFPYLVESCKSLPSILQEYWDKYFSKKPGFIILCGSSIRMMESLLGYKSPIYGRRTEQMLLEPLKFKDASLFFPHLSDENKVANYAILGGIPAYLLEFDYSKPLMQNIKDKILRKNKFLYQDVEFVLREELLEPTIYFSIIRSVAMGNTKMAEILNDTGLDKGIITKYLSVLQKLHLIQRIVPITEKNPEKSRNGIYAIKDNFFRFWFRFVFNNKEYIEQDKQDKLIEEKITPELNAFIGKAFEEIALEWLIGQKKFDNYLLGRWWDRKDEIDIVGIDKENILFCEVKWATLDKKSVLDIIQKLEEKSSAVQYAAAKKTFIVIAKKIHDKKTLKEEGFHTYDLEDML